MSAGKLPRSIRPIRETVMRIQWLCCLVLAVLSFQAPPAGAQEPMRVAFIAPLSGTFALVFEENLKLFRAVADDINAKGGVQGRRIEIVAFDNKGTPQETLIVLNQAIDQDIRYVLATISSIALTISDALTKYNSRNPDKPVLFLNYDAREPSLTEDKCSFWHFRFQPHSDMQVKVLTDHLAARPASKKVYMINQDYAWGHSFQRAARENLAKRRPDIEIVGDDLVPLGKVKDFAPYVAKIRASGADAVLTGNWGNDLSLLIKASNEAGLKATYYTLLGAFFGTPGAIGAAGADRVKTLYAYNINDADAASQMTLLAYKEKFGSLTNMSYLPAHRTVYMLALAMAKAQSDDPKKVAHALEGLKYAGPSGESWMRADDHQLIAPIYLLRFVKIGQPGVQIDEEKTGYGWKTEALIEAKDVTAPVKCQMQRP
jgi:branched-chain amino acid transport system substrate-binding protein